MSQIEIARLHVTLAEIEAFYVRLRVTYVGSGSGARRQAAREDVYQRARDAADAARRAIEAHEALAAAERRFRDLG